MIPISDKKKKNEKVPEDKKVEKETIEEVKPETAEQPEETATEEKKETKETKEEKKEKESSGAEELATANDKYLRLYAEFDNFKKRTQKEKDALYGDIKANITTSFLPVYDNLERALAQKTEDEAYYKGVEMIMTQFNQTLEKLGISEIPALGEKFDPTVHNAVMHAEDPEKGENEIVEVFQKGFKLGDKVIRFAMVKVVN